jgi:hypothetical protein
LNFSPAADLRPGQLSTRFADGDHIACHNESGFYLTVGSGAASAASAFEAGVSPASACREVIV